MKNIITVINDTIKDISNIAKKLKNNEIIKKIKTIIPEILKGDPIIALQKLLLIKVMLENIEKYPKKANYYIGIIISHLKHLEENIKNSNKKRIQQTNQQQSIDTDKTTNATTQQEQNLSDSFKDLSEEELTSLFSEAIDNINEIDQQTNQQQQTPQQNNIITVINDTINALEQNNHQNQENNIGNSSLNK